MSLPARARRITGAGARFPWGPSTTSSDQPRSAAGYAVAAVPLRLVQSLVGYLDQAVRQDSGHRGYRGHAQADRDDAAVHQFVRLTEVGHRLAGPLGDLVGAGRTGSRHDDRELLAAVTGDQVNAPYAAGQGPRDQPQAFVAPLVAVVIVVLLEVVDVDHREPDRLAGPQRTQPLGLEHLGEAPAVGQAGQRVGQGELLEPAVRLRELLGALGDLALQRGVDQRVL